MGTCNHDDNSDTVDWDWMYCHNCEEFLIDIEAYEGIICQH